MERLVTWLWQGMVLAVGVWGLLRLWRPNAATRFASLWATLAAIVLLLVMPPVLAGLSAADARASDAGVVARTALSGAASPGAAAPAAVVAAETLLPFTLPAVPSPFIALGIGAWLGFSLIGLVHLVVSVGHLRRIKRACRPFPPARERRLTRWPNVRREGCRARLCVSDDVRSASALGLGFGPAIIAINSSLLNDVDDEELDHIILHEYAHIRRGDDWLHVLQLALQAVLVLHPAVSWIGRALRLEREAACDEWVVERTRMPTAYAHCLTKVAAFELAGPNDLIAAMGMIGRRGELTRRIERLLAPHRAQHTRLDALPVASVATMLMVATLGMWQLPPLVGMERVEAAAVDAAAEIVAPMTASALASASARAVSEVSAADVLTRPSAITILREQPRQSPSRSVPPAPAIQLASFELPPVPVPAGRGVDGAERAATPSPIASRSVTMTVTPPVAMMPTSTAAVHVSTSGADTAADVIAEADAEASAVAAETAGEDPDGVASTSRRVWQRVASAGAAVGQRTADVSQSTARNLAARPSVRGTMTAGAAVGQAGATVGQGVGKGAKRAGTATGSFFARIGTSIYKALP